MNTVFELAFIYLYLSISSPQKKDIRRLSNTDIVNSTKLLVLDEIPFYPFACRNLKSAKLWSCFCFSFAWFCDHLTLFAERYASESFFFQILGINQQGFGNNVLGPKVFKKTGVLTIN